MWIDILGNNYFVNNLYDKIPELDNIRVEEFSLLENGNEIKIIFDMPKFADYPPEKWKGCNIVSIENKNYLKITLFGSINCEFKAEVGVIQKVSAYYM